MAEKIVSDLELCQRALALIREADALLEKVNEEPRGWCPWETRYHLEQAANMLEPLPADDDDDEPPRFPTLRLVSGGRRP